MCWSPILWKFWSSWLPPASSWLQSDSRDKGYAVALQQQPEWENSLPWAVPLMWGAPELPHPRDSFLDVFPSHSACREQTELAAPCPGAQPWVLGTTPGSGPAPSSADPSSPRVPAMRRCSMGRAADNKCTSQQSMIANATSLPPLCELIKIWIQAHEP